MSCSVRTNESNFLNCVMQYVIITFRQVIFSDASTSGLISELIICSLLHAFVERFNAFLKIFDAESFDNI